MSRIVSTSLGPATWRAGLADPHLHWRRSKSAWEMAVSWESRRHSESGLPHEVEAVLEAHSAFQNPRLLVGVVEHRVRLDTPKTPSQNDLWAMLLTDDGHVSVAFEAKAGEDFDRRISDWLTSDKDPTAKRKRLRWLCDVLGVQGEPPTRLRYQLFHRAASAVLEAKRWRASKALMLVQSFADSPTSWQDYVDFAALLGVTATRNSISGPARADNIDLYLGWVDSPLANDSAAATAI